MEQSRKTALDHAFEAGFDGRQASFYVSAPGRINLIGEHTDYNGFPVLPMAIGRAIRLAVRPRDDRRIVLRNAEPDPYPERTFFLGSDVEPYGAGNWGDYVKAAVQSLTRLALEQGSGPDDLRGMDCLVQGDIPPAAGLSSSTALVVASGLAFGAVNNLGLSRHQMAERMADAEHYVGTRGGGMDQAACLLGRPDCALKIDFFPLRVRPVPFPPDYRVVAAHSTVSARKTAEHRRAYNRRVLECQLGVRVLKRHFGRESAEHLADFDAPVRELLAVLREALNGDECLAPGQALRWTDEEMKDQLDDLDDPAEELKVLPRCRHVLTEAERTATAAACLEQGAVVEFGRLMDESHVSCAEDYEISCPELDELTALMREAGALGARLTGAGFGGFAVALVHCARAEEVRQAVRDRFYGARGLSENGRLFVFRPAAGAEVFVDR
ncbi:MAG: galactokinase [Candidatus Brocadiia bacterium]